MATLPQATTTVDESASPFAGGTDYLVVAAPVSQNADSTPRVFASTQDMLAFHKYSAGIDYCAMHFNETRKPLIFVGLPVTTAGALVWQDNTGVTGTCAITVSAASGGIMEKVNATVTVVTGTTVGTDQIVFDLSCDGGQSTQRVRLGTATSYTIPNFGIVLSFASGGTLNRGDVFAFRTSAPMWGSTAMSTARLALAAQQSLARSWLVIGSVPNATFANYVLTEANNYESTNERFVYARAQIADFLPLAQKQSISYKAVNPGSLTFDGTAHTITRTTGSWITDGFVTGMGVTVAGSTSNNGFKGAVTVTSATVLTFVSGLTTETDASGVTVSASNTLTFDGTGHTITRSAGSWLTEGFAVGQTVAITGTASNNVSAAITALSATVMTFASGLSAEGPIASSGVEIVQVQTFAGDVAAQNAAFASIDGQKRLDLAYGHGVKLSPITGWLMRRPAAWAATLREYQHDVQIPTYRKADGPLNGWSLTDDNGNTVEYDERIDGGALAARFTCLRSYGNGPLGAFVALSLTRDSEGAILSRTHNLAVANLACTVVQAETENAIGQVLELNDDGTGTDASLSLIEKRVNRALQVNLLQNFAEGPRSSKAVWTASRTDVLNTAGAPLHGTLALNLNGTLENIDTVVRVNTGA